MIRILTATALALILAAPSSAPAQARVDRLETLAASLETVPDAKFSMADWSNGRHPVTGEPLTSCAAGWGARIPEFAAAGLRLDFDQSLSAWMIRYRGRSEFPACADFFGISQAQARDLFAARPPRGDDRRAAIARIRACAARERFVVLLSSL